MTGNTNPAPAPYRRTLFDRYGLVVGDAMKAAAWGAMVGVLAVIVTARVTIPRGYSVPAIVALCVLAGLTAWVVTIWLTLRISAAAGAGFAAFVAPSGTYEYDYSREESLAARGDVAGALAAYEQHIIAAANNVVARSRAAELYAGKGGNPARAAELLREVQRIPRVSRSDHLHATNRLIDLYIGPLNDLDGALWELRRLVQAYPPSTDVGKHARTALLELKQRQTAEDAARAP
jgi:hypothetical protein